MGHDIFAMRVSEQQQDTIRAKYNLDRMNSNDWRERYSAYCDEVYIAKFRRNAFDPWNRALYVALSAEQAYGGASGIGLTLTFTLDEIEKARKAIDNADGMPAPEREENDADILFRMLRDSLGVKIVRGDTLNDLEPEREFLDKCAYYMRDTGVETIDIYFG